MTPLDHRRVYRAHIEAFAAGMAELTVYVEAPSHEAAIARMKAAVVAWQPWRKDVDEALYNCSSAAECIEQGESADFELRLFEVGWGGGRGPIFCRDPVFLVDNPGAWAAKWAAAQGAAEASTRGERR